MQKVVLLSVLFISLSCSGCNNSQSVEQEPQRLRITGADGQLAVDLDVGAGWQKMAAPPSKSAADAMYPERRTWFERDTGEYLSIFVGEANHEYRKSQQELAAAILDGVGPKHLQELADLFKAKRSGESQVLWSTSSYKSGGITGYRPIEMAEVIVVSYQAKNAVKAADSVLEILNSANLVHTEIKK